MSSPQHHLQHKPARPQQAVRTADRQYWQQQQHQGYDQGHQGQYRQQQDGRLQYQQQQQEYYSSQQSNVTQMQVNNNADKVGANSWAARGLSQAIAGVLALVSILTLIMSIRALSSIQESRRLLAASLSMLPSTSSSSSSTKGTSWSRSGSSSSSTSSDFDDPSKSINANFEATFAQALIYAYILIGTASLQILLSVLGFFGVTKGALNMYKAYVYATPLFFVAWIVLVVLLGGWYLIVSVLVHVAVMYPMWAGLKRWEGKVRQRLEY